MKRITSLVAVLALALSLAFTAPPGKGKHQLTITDPATGAVEEVEVGKCYAVTMRKVPLDGPAGFSLDLEDGTHLRFFSASVLGGRGKQGVALAECVVFPQEINGVQTHGVNVVVSGYSFTELLAEVTVFVRAEF